MFVVMERSRGVRTVVTVPLAEQTTVAPPHCVTGLIGPSFLIAKGFGSSGNNDALSGNPELDVGLAEI